ncbi:MAG: hypothetical protein AB7H77_05460, partial [Bdellovibrionales bacterium]
MVQGTEQLELDHSEDDGLVAERLDRDVQDYIARIALNKTAAIHFYASPFNLAHEFENAWERAVPSEPRDEQVKHRLFNQIEDMWEPLLQGLDLTARLRLVAHASVDPRGLRPEADAPAVAAAYDIRRGVLYHQVAPGEDIQYVEVPIGLRLLVQPATDSADQQPQDYAGGDAYELTDSERNRWEEWRREQLAKSLPLPKEIQTYRPAFPRLSGWGVAGTAGQGPIGVPRPGVPQGFNAGTLAMAALATQRGREILLRQRAAEEASRRDEEIQSTKKQDQEVLARRREEAAGAAAERGHAESDRSQQMRRDQEILARRQEEAERQAEAAKRQQMWRVETALQLVLYHLDEVNQNPWGNPYISTLQLEMDKLQGMSPIAGGRANIDIISSHAYLESKEELWEIFEPEVEKLAREAVEAQSRRQKESAEAAQKEQEALDAAYAARREREMRAADYVAQEISRAGVMLKITRQELGATAMVREQAVLREGLAARSEASAAGAGEQPRMTAEGPAMQAQVTTGGTAGRVTAERPSEAPQPATSAEPPIEGIRTAFAEEPSALGPQDEGIARA